MGVIFLGAGASKPFGIPTMEELTEVVLNSPSLTDTDRKCINDIKNIIGDRIKLDIEALLCCVDD